MLLDYRTTTLEAKGERSDDDWLKGQLLYNCSTAVSITNAALDRCHIELDRQVEFRTTTPKAQGECDHCGKKMMIL